MVCYMVAEVLVCLEGLANMPVPDGLATCPEVLSTSPEVLESMTSISAHNETQLSTAQFNTVSTVLYKSIPASHEHSSLKSLFFNGIR